MYEIYIKYVSRTIYSSTSAQATCVRISEGVRITAVITASPSL